MANVEAISKSKTIDDAVVRSLRVRGRMDLHGLVFSAQVRFEREAKSKRPTIVAVKKTIAKLAAKKVITKLENGRYELGTKAPPAPPKPKRVAKEPLPAGRCFFPIVDRDVLAKVRARIEKRFEVTQKTETAIFFRSRLHLEPPDRIFRVHLGERKEAIRRMKPHDQRAMDAHVPKFTAFLVLLFDNVHEIVNESDTLIDAQLTVASVTKGPMFNAWNREYVKSFARD